MSIRASWATQKPIPMAEPEIVIQDRWISPIL